MKFVAAYLPAYLGAESAEAAAAAEGGDAPAPVSAAAPTKEDVRRILGSVGAEVEDDRLDLLFAQLEGKDVAELLAAGRGQLAYAPSAAAIAGVGGAPAAAGAAAAEAKEDEKEEKKEDEEEEDDQMFSLFDDE